ncbi:transposase [Streptomyces nigra]|uniref:IS110 family transposase n=1 Tax=Streptomyces nigra TaxID=1827580 RepID=UPI0034541EF1
MTALAEPVDGVIGVDTHRDTLAAAAVSPIGAALATTDAANARGYRRLLEFARQHIPDRRCGAVEGVGSYGAGLAAFLDQAGEQAVEVLRPKRSAVRGGRKTEMPDAIRAGKGALASKHLIQPRDRGEREALRVLLVTRHGAVLASTAAINQFRGLIVSAPDGLRTELRKLKRPAQINRCAQLSDGPAQSIEHRMTVRALRSTAQRVHTLQAVRPRAKERSSILCVRWLLSCCNSKESDRSPQPRCWSVGHTRAVSVPRPPSRRSSACR